MISDKSKIKCIVFRIFIMVAAIVQTLPILATVCYMGPVQDDFYYANEYNRMRQAGYSVIGCAIKHAYDYYVNFSGFYVDSFLDMLFAGVITYDSTKMRILCFIVVSFFFVSVYFLTKGIVSGIFQQKDEKLIGITYILLLVCFTNVSLYRDNYFWYLCIISYLLVCSLIFIGISAYISSIEKDDSKLLIVAAVLAFIGSGSSLNVVVLNCGFFLLTAIWAIEHAGKKFRYVVPFLCALAGGLINAAAPGNFKRYGQPLTAQGLAIAGYRSVSYAVTRIGYLFSNTLFVFVVAALLLVILAGHKKISVKFRYPALLSIISFIAIAFVAFPVMLGYNGYYDLDRSIFFSDTVIYVMTIVNIFYWIMWAETRERKVSIKCRTACLFTVPLVIGLLLFFRYKGNYDFPWYRMSKQLINGEVKEYSDSCDQVQKQILEDKGADVVIVTKEIPESTVLYGPGYCIEDIAPVGCPNIPEYYHKKSIKLIYK